MAGEPFQIREDDLNGPEIIALIETHVAHMSGQSPKECCHVLNIDALRVPEITFWSVWDGDQLVGCGALKEIASNHGEIKSMHTAAVHRGRGVGNKVLAHIVAEATNRGYNRLSLETGSTDGFEPALNMYRNAGFKSAEPFGDYAENPFTVFLALDLPETD